MHKTYAWKTGIGPPAEWDFLTRLYFVIPVQSRARAGKLNLTYTFTRWRFFFFRGARRPPLTFAFRARHFSRSAYNAHACMLLIGSLQLLTVTLSAACNVPFLGGFFVSFGPPPRKVRLRNRPLRTIHSNAFKSVLFAYQCAYISYRPIYLTVCTSIVFV